MLKPKRVLVSLFLGILTSWLARKNLALILMGGKTFDDRSLLVQTGFLIACIVLISLLCLVFISISGLLFHRELESINKKLTPLVKSGVAKFVGLFTNLALKMAEKLVTPAKELRAIVLRVYKSMDDSLRVNSLIFKAYLSESANVIITLTAIALAAYGFELFNLNFTLDEEIFAFPTQHLIGQILEDGRWGMYLLSKYVLPYSIIPFVPLGLALLFQLGGILLMLKSWKVTSKFEQVIIGAIGITFPSLVYIYVYSPLNYGIGIGFFCIGLSLFLYSEKTGPQKYLAVIPAAFAFSIYQALIPVLALAFLIYIIRIGIQMGQKLGRHLINISCIHILAFFAYYVIQMLLLPTKALPVSSHVSSFFDIQALYNNFGYIFASYWDILFRVYFGDTSIYSVKINLLGALLIASLLGAAIGLWRSRSSIAYKLLIALFTVTAFLSPFASGLLMNGAYPMRFLLGLPIVISGLTMLGLGENPRIYKMLVGFLALVCIFQFTVSTNHLFASSHLALQNDRLLASRLMQQIQDAQAEAHTTEKLKYMEIVGHLSIPSSELIFKKETVGASFFGFEPSSFRELQFMKTLGYQGLQITPVERRYQLVEIGNPMPIWPEKGSVRVVGDTVLIKLGPYTDRQKEIICEKIDTQGNEIKGKTVLKNEAFCK